MNERMCSTVAAFKQLEGQFSQLVGPAGIYAMNDLIHLIASDRMYAYTNTQFFK